MSDDDLFGFDPDRVGDAVRQPPLASLRQRAQARRRRRNVLTGSGAVALALVLIGPVALPFTAGLTGPDRPEHVEPPTTVGDLVVLDERTAVGVELTTCTVRFTRTLDGGQTWSPYKGVDHSQRCILDAEGHGISDIRYQILGDRSYLYFDGRAGVPHGGRGTELAGRRLGHDSCGLLPGRRPNSELQQLVPGHATTARRRPHVR